MSDTRQLLLDAASRLFDAEFTVDSVRGSSDGSWPEGSWQAMTTLGLPLALVDEHHGGSGIDAVDALELLRLAGRYAAPIPLAESMLGNFLLTRSGFAPVHGIVTLAPVTVSTGLHLSRDAAGWQLSGEAPRVPWGRYADYVVVSADFRGHPHLALAVAGGWRLAHESNIAGSPRDTLIFDTVLHETAIAPLAPAALTPLAAGAAARVLLIAGALQRLLEITMAHVQERIQFGRALARFQVVQHEIARLAAQVASAGAAADAATAGILESNSSLLIAAAKVRAAEAAGVAAAIAHQLHGAMGFADEHPLSLLTKSLWAWRDEFGSQAHWSRTVGCAVFESGSGSVWPLVTAI